MLLTASIGVAHVAPVLASFDPVDEHSLANGAQLYEVFCSDCHGSDPGKRYDQLYAPNASVAADDEYQKLIDIVEQEEAAQLIVVPDEEEPWPEWAELPDPNAQKPPDEKTEVMNTLTAVIDEAHGIKPASTPQNTGSGTAFPGELPYGQAVDAGPAVGFEPIPGATNLADPASYLYGISEDEIFKSIAEGTGAAMPGFRAELGDDEAIMDVVNYIRSFWSEEWLY